MIKYIETHIVDHCNLKCAGCTHFSPLSNEYYKPLEEYKNEIRQLQKITNGEIGTFRIMGGEPFLHPQALDFCIATRELFPNTSIVIASNGILLNQLSDEIINIYNKYNIALCISEYGINIDRNKYNKFNSHYSYGKSQMYNPSIDLTGSQNARQSFYSCDMVNSSCAFLKDGRIYQCALAAEIDIFNEYFNQNITYNLDDISISIYDYTEQEINNFLSIPCDFCKYCNTNVRYTLYHPFMTSKKDISEWISQ